MRTKEIIKQIKRINERSRDIARTFGTNSSYYESYMNAFNKIESILEGSTSRVRGKAHFRISTSKKIIEKMNEKILKILEDAEKSIKTKGQVVSEVKKRYDIKETQQAIEKAISISDTNNFVKDNLDKLYEISDFKTEIRRKNKKHIDEDMFDKMKEYIDNPNYREKLIKKELGIDDSK